MMFRLAGVHHVSALSAHIGRTHDFYTRVLGMRPVIKTVSQDEPSMYHLFFGDAAGSPGSDLTVFDMTQPGVALVGHDSPGTGSHTVAVDPTTHDVYFPLAVGPDGTATLRILRPSGL